jgi:spermidine/putrescine transport system permease protein
LGLGRPELLFTKTAVVIALVHIYLPFVILVIYAALRNLPPELLQLSSDLGASPVRRFVSVVLPITATGIASSFLYVFVLSASDYVTPQFLGGRQAQMVGVLIQSEFTQKGDYPSGAAMALTLLMTFVVVYVVVASTVRILGLHRVAVRSG